MMSLEKYTEEAKKGIRERLKAEPRKDVEKYIMALERRGYIESSYNENVKLCKIRGTENINPNSYCYGIMMLYPDFPSK